MSSGITLPSLSWLRQLLSALNITFHNFLSTFCSCIFRFLLSESMLLLKPLGMKTCANMISPFLCIQRHDWIQTCHRLAPMATPPPGVVSRENKSASCIRRYHRRPAERVVRAERLKSCVPITYFAHHCHHDTICITARWRSLAHSVSRGQRSNHSTIIGWQDWRLRLDGWRLSGAVVQVIALRLLVPPWRWRYLEEDGEGKVQKLRGLGYGPCLTILLTENTVTLNPLLSPLSHTRIHVMCVHASARAQTHTYTHAGRHTYSYHERDGGERQRQRETERDRERERQWERESETERDRKRQRQRERVFHNLLQHEVTVTKTAVN